ncbi:MAG: alpha/beta fold hydrolase [Deltaproteobacteria bacterium]|nr:alpha/beta fold hydrolase [Deltaproteobacteria bacterium]
MDIDGARVAYAEAGSGEPVVLLHGYPQSHEAWRHQIPELAATHRVIAVDWVGWGASEKRADLSYAYGDEVARVGKLLDALGIARANLFGHDYGGYLALGFAAAHPNRVLRLAVLNSRAHDTFPRVGFWAVWLMCVLARLAPWLMARLPLTAIHRLGLESYAAAGCFDRAQVERYVAWLDEPAGRRWFAAFYRGYQVRPRRGNLAALARAARAPMAFVWGTDDEWCPPAIALELHAAVPGSLLTLLDHGNHYILEHRPADVTAALRALLAAAAPSDPAPAVAPATAPPTPLRASATVRAAILAGWAWSVCAGLIVFGMLGLFFEDIGGLSTNQTHAIVLNLAVGFLGFAFARFGLEALFVLASGIGMVAVSAAGFSSTTQEWMYSTFNLNATSSWIELVSGMVSLALWLAFRPQRRRTP